MNPIQANPDDYKKILGQVLHHIGVEIEGESIDIHGSTLSQGKALNYIGQIMRDANVNRLEDLLGMIESELKLKPGTYHILELSQVLLSENWKERLAEVRKRV